MTNIDVTCHCGICDSCRFYIELEEETNRLEWLNGEEEIYCIAHIDGYYIINDEKRCCRCVVNQIMSDIEIGNYEALSQYFGNE